MRPLQLITLTTTAIVLFVAGGYALWQDLQRLRDRTFNWKQTGGAHGQLCPGVRGSALGSTAVEPERESSHAQESIKKPQAIAAHQYW